MKQHNLEQQTINYREPFGTSFRRGRRQFTGVNYNDRSPEVAAMNAHLQASAYGERKHSSAVIGHNVIRAGEASTRPRVFF